MFSFINNFLDRFSLDIGIDLGTANTLVYVKGKGIVLRESSVVAIDQQTQKPVAVGEEAKKMLGRTPESIAAIRPLKDGVIADLEAAERMISDFIHRVQERLPFSLKTRILIGVPSGITDVEKRAVYQAAHQAGSGVRPEIYPIPEPLVAAIGAGLPILEPSGSMIVDIGGGTTEVAVMSMGRIVISDSLRVAGDEINEAIINYIRKVHNVSIGERTSETIKIQMGSAYTQDQEMVMDIRGLNLVSGLPCTISITASEIREAIMEPVRIIIESIRSTLENTPPEMAADIIDRGIILAGGGALLDGLDELICRNTEVPVYVAEDPLSCVVMGTGRILEEISKDRNDEWRDLLNYYRYQV